MTQLHFNGYMYRVTLCHSIVGLLDVIERNCSINELNLMYRYGTTTTSCWSNVGRISHFCPERKMTSSQLIIS